MTAPASPKAERLLSRFPKTRPALPPAFQAIYAAQYKENRSGGSAAASLAQRIERWLHRQVAADVANGGANGGAKSTLELGAGTLNQLPFEPAGAPYDVVEPFAALFEGSPHRARVRDVFSDIAEAPLDRRYERITSVAAMEHVCDLPALLARAAALLAPGGVFRAGIPAEGGLLWRIGWMATTGLEFRLRHGLDYGVMMAHEHVNTAAEIEALVAAIFADVRIRSLGVGRQFSLYRFIEAREPRLDVARAWAARFEPRPPRAE